MGKRWIIVLILVLALVLRFSDISQIPPSPSLDEVSIGYNAYSILFTGKDEYGSAFPVLLRAYDDYRPALYVYVVVPFIWLFGLTAIAVRFPSVMLGVVLVYLTYIIGRIVGRKYFGDDGVGRYAAFFVAISPWHVYLSRLGHEANLGLTLLVLGIYFLLRTVMEGDRRAIIWGGIVFGLSLHGYQSQKIVTPLLVITGIVLFWNEIWKVKRQAFIGGIMAFVIAVPAVIATLSPHGMTRLAGTSAISGKTKLEAATVVMANYVSHFSPVWLFAGSNREAHKTPGIGLLYLWEAPLLILGMWSLWRSRIPKKLKMFLLIWLLSSPLPASITTQAPHAMRSYTFIPILQFVSAMGLWILLKTIHDRMRLYIGIVGGFIVAFTLGSFWISYTERFPTEQSDSFQYAMKGAVDYALAEESNYNRVEFSHQGALYQSYMFYLFYSRLDPKKYLTFGGTGSGGYEAAHYIEKYSFGFIPENKEQAKQNVLYFYDARYLPEGFRVIRPFTNLDGTTAIIAATL